MICWENPMFLVKPMGFLVARSKLPSVSVWLRWDSCETPIGTMRISRTAMKIHSHHFCSVVLLGFYRLFLVVLFRTWISASNQCIYKLCIDCIPPKRNDAIFHLWTVEFGWIYIWTVYPQSMNDLIFFKLGFGQTFQTLDALQKETNMNYMVQFPLQSKAV